MALDPLPVGTVRLRPAGLSDDAFLARLFRDARPQLAALPLPDEQRIVLIDQQWRGRRAGYAAAWPAAVDSIIECGGKPVGHVLLDVAATTTVVDLAVLSDARGRGVATAALRAVLADADRQNNQVQLRVARGNPAEQLYARLGFVVVDANDVDVQMERAPGGRG